MFQLSGRRVLVTGASGLVALPIAVELANLGRKPKYVENSTAWPIWADTTKMAMLLGPSRVSIREGVRRVIGAG